MEEGSIEWFRARTHRLIGHARALDSISGAKEKIGALAREWNDTSEEIKSALHTAGIIEYARPFTQNAETSGKRAYPTKHLRRSEAFDSRLHQHLLNLRNKLVAHSDGEVLRSAIAHKFAHLTISGHRKSVPIATSVHVRSLSGISDFSLCARYLTHFEGCLAAIESEAHELLEAVQSQALKHPENLRDPELERGLVIDLAGGQKFAFNEEHAVPVLPPGPNPTGLPMPHLILAGDGYVYREFVLERHLEGLIPVVVNGVTGTLNLSSKSK
jgi:hypothetical protein